MRTTACNTLKRGVINTHKPTHKTAVRATPQDPHSCQRHKAYLKPPHHTPPVFTSTLASMKTPVTVPAIPAPAATDTTWPGFRCTCRSRSYIAKSINNFTASRVTAHTIIILESYGPSDYTYVEFSDNWRFLC